LSAIEGAGGNAAALQPAATRLPAGLVGGTVAGVSKLPGTLSRDELAFQDFHNVEISPVLWPSENGKRKN
jgi:hypothetical protein